MGLPQSSRTIRSWAGGRPLLYLSEPACKLPQERCTGDLAQAALRTARFLRQLTARLGQEPAAPAFDPRCGSRSRRSMPASYTVSARAGKPWDTTRNPTLLFRLFGLLLLRLAQRTLLSLLFHEPPRNVPAGPYNNRATRPRPHRSPVVAVSIFCQPPSSRPISATMRPACSYCPCAQPAPVMGQAQVEAHLVQLGVGRDRAVAQPLPPARRCWPRPVAPGSRSAASSRRRVTVWRWVRGKWLVMRHQPGQEVVGLGEDGHFARAVSVTGRTSLSSGLAQAPGVAVAHVVDPAHARSRSTCAARLPCLRR